MKKDIYDLLNNGNFNEEEYENKGNEEFNDFDIKRVEGYIKKKSNGRKRNNKIKVVAVAAACVFMIGICSSGVGTKVLASVSNMIRKIDPNKNYKSDYVVELGESYSKDGVEIKLDECYRSGGKLRLVYTMNFEKGVPESIKAKERLRTTLEPEKGHSYEYVDYENDGIVESNEVSVNDWNVNDKAHNIKIEGNTFQVIGEVWDCQSKDIEIGEKSIKKELVFTVVDSIKDDLNIKIKYENIVDNSGEKIEGPWEINYKVSAEPEVNDIKKTNLDKDYGRKFQNGFTVSINSYANTNTGIKIYGKMIDENKNGFVVRLQGIDNLGNEILMYPKGAPNNMNDKDSIEFTLYDGQTGNRQSLKEGVTSLKLRLYADKTFEDEFEPAGDEFTVNIQ
ncbi:DUF4179 domain-containing protein [Clostridium sp. SHJSY1]|uniref:DUF4179 domain-containing protein n=1 Tax=Clostridium sp. SHJSY1 TaxID=2942483 RepID=UPI0028768C8C|nr:DUF4179 domain-containing protein [Clostridium sp. SHJSY1]MDS0525504.1 DUF4179 domain-containing protein [Clostridium sp. SHJSY1]